MREGKVRLHGLSLLSAPGPSEPRHSDVRVARFERMQFRVTPLCRGEQVRIL